MNKIFENIYAENNKKSHLKENDFFVGHSGNLMSEVDPDDKPVNDIPVFVRQFFGYDDGPALVAEFSETPDNCAIEPAESDKPDCTRTNVEYRHVDSCPDCCSNEQESSYPDDNCVGEWLDLSNLKDDSPISSVLNLIKTNFETDARCDSGTDQDTIITVNSITDNDKIRELIDIITGTLSSGGFGIEGYRLCDGNLQLRISR